MVNITHAPMNEAEIEDRDVSLAEVLDPSYMFRVRDADAEGEVDDVE